MIKPIKARYRRMGSQRDGPPVIDVDGIVPDTTLGLSPGTVYALRDALSAALDDWENDLDELLKVSP